MRALFFAIVIATLAACAGTGDSSDSEGGSGGKDDGLFSKDPVEFWCQTTGWTEYSDSEFDESYDRAFFTTVACETVSEWTLNGSLDAAQEACAAWGASFGLDSALIETVTYTGEQRDNCHGDWQEFERTNFGDLRINKVHRVSNDFGDVGFTLLFVDNRGKEAPISLEDGGEQPQWVVVDDDAYCGFPGADIAFHEVFEGQGSLLTVRQLTSGREAVYRSIDTANFEFRTDAFELVRAADGDDEFSVLTSTPFLTRSADMGGNTIEFRAALTDAATSSFEISYFSLADEHLCEP